MVVLVRLEEVFQPRRGDVFQLPLGVEQTLPRGCHRVVVIQGEIANKFSPTITVIPLSANSRLKNILFSAPITPGGQNGLNKECVALCLQIRTLSRRHFTPANFIGSLSEEDMAKIDTILAFTLGLNQKGKTEKMQKTAEFGG
ncbi:MAG: type II toxin-antitoxin system PemK/MazF family toxin [Bacillota bacterium]|uniref:type II toxin-antitoxin system PemK/MazF family toxin n=1 Tax=Carboxydocella TaxID=178898 RepID=UPI00099AE4B1|nr:MULTISPECIES: type II toxin-antitoxin system PemK/MazF family toxin [Carboxydocella]